MHILAKWVLVLQEAVAVCVLGDGAAVAHLLVVGIPLKKGLRVPANLLSSCLRELASLPRLALRVQNALLHRLLLEHAVNSGGVEIELGRLSRFAELADVTGSVRVDVVGLLSDVFN